MYVFEGFKFVINLLATSYKKKNSPLCEYQRCDKENFPTNKTKENCRVIKWWAAKRFCL